MISLIAEKSITLEQFKAPADAADHPPCGWCGGPVIKRRREKPSKYRIRQGCSHRCSQLIAASRAGGRKAGELPDHPPCPGCGGWVPKSKNQSAAEWIAAEYCSHGCKTAHGERDPDWPEITGFILRGTPFADHNVEPRDGGPLRLLPEPTHVGTASALGGRI